MISTIIFNKIMFTWEQSITLYFPLILLQNIIGYLNSTRLVVLVIELPRVAFIVLKGSIGIIIAYAYYLPLEAVLVLDPIPDLKFLAFHNDILYMLEWKVIRLRLKTICRIWFNRRCRCRCISLDSQGLDVHQVNIVVPLAIPLPCID